MTNLTKQVMNCILIVKELYADLVITKTTIHFHFCLKIIFTTILFYSRSRTTKDIRLSDSSIIFENDLNWWVKISYGNPDTNTNTNTNGSDRPYFSYYQTWLMYYTMHLSNATTSFKILGDKKDMPLYSFYQIATPYSSVDTLYYASDVRIHKVYLKK